MTRPDLHTVFAPALRAADRAAARTAWAREAVAAVRRADQLVDEAWDRWLDEHADEDDDFDPPEQAALDALLEQINDVMDHDRWPRHLYWGDV